MKKRDNGMTRAEEYRQLTIQCALRLFCQYQDMSEAKAFAAAGRFVAELRKLDAAESLGPETASGSLRAGSAGPEPGAGDEENNATPDKENPYILAAIARYAEGNDDVEVDLDAVVAEADGGAFVQLWGWVDDADLP